MRSVFDRRGSHGLRVAGIPVLGLLLVGVLLFSSGSALAASEGGIRLGSAVRPAQRMPISDVISTLLAAINKDRAQHHVAPLRLDTTQSICSRRHSVHMASLGFITHDQFPADVCVRHTWAGENVGVDSADALTSALVLHRMMMDEGPCPHRRCPGTEFEAHGHYVNLMNPQYTRVGIGLVWNGASLWLTEDFTD